MDATTFTDIAFIYIGFFAFAFGIALAFMLWLAYGGKDK